MAPQTSILGDPRRSVSGALLERHALLTGDRLRRRIDVALCGGHLPLERLAARFAYLARRVAANKTVAAGRAVVATVAVVAVHDGLHVDLCGFLPDVREVRLRRCDR